MINTLDGEKITPTPLPSFQDNKKVYTVDEIQDILGIGLSTTYKLIKANKFHHVKVGHRVLVSKPSFDAWLKI